MKRINIYLTKKQIEYFDKFEKRMRSELIRRAIDEFIKKEEWNENISNW